MTNREKLLKAKHYHGKHIENFKYVAKLFKVKLSFYFNVNRNLGEYDYSKKHIYLNLAFKNQDELISAFFHELGHFIDHKNKKYYAYYKVSSSLKDLRRVALKAEHHADDTGYKVSTMFYKNFIYKKAYRNKRTKNALKLYFKDLRFKEKE